MYLLFLVACIISLQGGISASKIKVLHPSQLKQQFHAQNTNKILEIGLIGSSLGNFGHINYGTTITGRLHYPKNNTNGCLPFQDNQFEASQLEHGRKQRQKPIIMVDRGQCHFVLKAQHVEAYGGVMMIVADNKVRENIQHIVMADDGKGSSVHIPSFLISAQDGITLREAIHARVQPTNQAVSSQNIVIIQGQIDLTTKTTNQVELDLWYSSIYELAMDDIDLLNYREIARIFDNQIKFQPRTLISSCRSCSAAHKQGSCINDGQYCPILPDSAEFRSDPEFLSENKLSPKEVIIQNLREQCVFEAFGGDEKSAWFEYIDEVISTCIEDSEQMNQDIEDLINGDRDADEDADGSIKLIAKECHDAVVNKYAAGGPKGYKLNVNEYDTCVQQQTQLLEASYKREHGDQASYLDRDHQLQLRIGSIFHPSVSINNHTFRGDYNDPNILFKAVCDTMTSKPERCSSVNLLERRSQDEQESQTHIFNKSSEIDQQLVKENYQRYDKALQGMERRAGFAEFALALVVLFLLNCSIVICCKLHNKQTRSDKMKVEVDEQVSQYFKLPATEDNSQLQLNPAQ